MNCELKSVEPASDYTLILTFNNDEIRIFDIQHYYDIGIFKELKDISLFRSVRKSFDTVEWPNEADIDPETLYNESKSIKSN